MNSNSSKSYQNTENLQQQNKYKNNKENTTKQKEKRASYTITISRFKYPLCAYLLLSSRAGISKSTYGTILTII